MKKILILAGVLALLALATLVLTGCPVNDGRKVTAKTPPTAG